MAQHPEPLVNAWQEASSELGFAFEGPYTLTIDDERFSVIGFLRDFGSPKGMILDTWISGFSTNTHSLHEAAKRAGIFCSCISAETYGQYSKNVFIEALNDWGYFGPEKARPSWARPLDTGSGNVGEGGQ